MPLSLEEVREAIRQRSGAWTAEETEVSRLVGRGNTSLFGLSLSEPDRVLQLRQAEDLESKAFFSQSTPPPRFTWRDHDGCDWLTSVKNQQTCGSCVSFATCGVLEARCRIARRDCKLSIDLS